MIGRDYFARQAATLLKFANENPQLAAVLVEKAADLSSEIENIPDPSPLAPDVEPRHER